MQAALLDEYIRAIYLSTRREILTKDGDMMACIDLWRQFYVGLASIVEPPYLGFCKVFEGVRNCLWLGVGGKSIYFYPDSVQILNS